MLPLQSVSFRGITTNQALIKPACRSPEPFGNNNSFIKNSFGSAVNLPFPSGFLRTNRRRYLVECEANGNNNGSTFLSPDEVGLVELTGLEAHEKFLARLTISSLNLLRVIAEEENLQIEDLNAGKLCDWFTKDKARRQTDPQSAILKWDNEPFS